MSLLASFRSAGSSTSVTLPASAGESWGDTRNDEFRLIKWHFLSNLEALQSSGKNPRIILITSAREGEGKSYIAHHLAANFALDPHLNLTLIDANPEHPALGTSSWMDTSSGGAGLFDYLDGGAEQNAIIRSTGLSNVKVILSGNARDSAPELLATDRMSGLLTSLVSSGNSFVVIDAGPVLKNGGAAVLARHAGQIGYVVATNVTRRADAMQGLSILDRLAGPIDEKSLGLILN